MYICTSNLCLPLLAYMIVRSGPVCDNNSYHLLSACYGPGNMVSTAIVSEQLEFFPKGSNEAALLNGLTRIYRGVGKLKGTNKHDEAQEPRNDGKFLSFLG